MAVDVRGFDFGPSVFDVLRQRKIDQSALQSQELSRNALAQQIAQRQSEAVFKQQQQQEIAGLAGSFRQPPQAGAPLLGQPQAVDGAPQQPETQEAFEQRMNAVLISQPEKGRQILESLGLNTQFKKDDFADFAFRLKSTPFDQRDQLINEHAINIEARGGDATQTRSLLGQDETTQNQNITSAQLASLSVKERMDIAGGGALSVEQRGFETLIKDFTPEEKERARRVKARIIPGAVGSAIQTITEVGTAEEVAETSAVIKQREKFAELTGASRAKAIDSGFERIVKIDKGIMNIGRAIDAIKGGAETGAIAKFLPSFRAASVELDQIKNELALDVIGGVTLGAISESELDLVKLVAIPSGLDGPELVTHLEERRAAQQKVRAYFQEQIDFLERGGPDGKGGTVAGFLRMKRRERDSQTQQAPEQGGAPLPDVGQMTDAQLRELAGI